MDRPLAALKILDFTTLLPGPFATMMLADLGAEVVRIEAPNRPDMVRAMPPFDGDVSAWHAHLNRSKRSLALDLKQPGAVNVVQRLVQNYDIVIEQFRPGVMARLGLDYPALSRINPRVICCSITGYGQTGPFKDRAGHDANYLALAGVMSHTGRKASGPAGMGVQVADVGGGSFGAVVGILSAVIQRQTTGIGQAIDISMFDMAVAWNGLALAFQLVGGENPTFENMPLNGGGYYDYYRTRDGRYLSVGSVEPKFWEGFCSAIGKSELAGMGYDPDPAVQQALKAALRETIASKELAEWVAVFEQCDVCVEPVLTAAETLTHPQTLARGLIVQVPRPDGTSQPQVGSPYRFSGSQAAYPHIGAPAGAHTNEVLAETGDTAEDIADMRVRGLFGD